MANSRDRRQRGFTLIEVMFALLIFMVALMGLVGLQRVANSGSYRGKQHTAAVNVGRTFLTQLQMETGSWWEGFDLNFPADQFPLMTPAVLAPNTWINLHSADEFRVGEFLGHSEMASAPDPEDAKQWSRYCVNYMVSPLENRKPEDVDDANIVVWKVRVRVSWTKQKQYNGDAWKNCSPASVAERLALGTDDAIELVGAATRELAR